MCPSPLVARVRRGWAPARGWGTRLPRGMGLVLLVLLPPLGGCILVPITYQHSDSGPNGLSLAEAEPMVKNRLTTRSQLQQKLGTGLQLAAGRLWIYTFWESSYLSAWLAAVSPMGGGADTLQGNGDSIHFLLIEFDDADVVRRHRVRRAGRINPSATGWDDAFQ